MIRRLLKKLLGPTKPAPKRSYGYAAHIDSKPIAVPRDSTECPSCIGMIVNRVCPSCGQRVTYV